jgi:hypothetical protein
MLAAVPWVFYKVIHRFREEKKAIIGETLNLTLLVEN